MQFDERDTACGAVGGFLNPPLWLCYLCLNLPEMILADRPFQFDFNQATQLY
jgi:hypothetical protein